MQNLISSASASLCSHTASFYGKCTPYSQIQQRLDPCKQPVPTAYLQTTPKPSALVVPPETDPATVSLEESVHFSSDSCALCCWHVIIAFLSLCLVTDPLMSVRCLWNLAISPKRLVPGTKRGTSEALSRVGCCPSLSVCKKTSGRWQRSAALAFQRSLLLEVGWMSLLFFTLCYQSPCAWFFYKLYFWLLTSGLFHA